MDHSNYRAVLTGDIIGSSRLNARRLATIRSTLVDSVNDIRAWKRRLVRGQMGFFRGDGWQLLLTDPAMALRACVWLRASLLAGGIADTRIAIGLGAVDKSLSSRVALSTGQAFELSGRALDRMTLYSSLAIEIPPEAGPLADWLSVVGSLCDSLIRQWTRRQAQLVCAVVGPKEPGYDEAARSLRPAISKQAVAKGLRGANWYAIREAIHQFEKTPWATVLRPKS